MSEQNRILEVPEAELIDRGFLEDVFSHQEFFEVRVAVETTEVELLSNLERCGFKPARQFSRGRRRFQRLRQTRFEFIELVASHLMAEHGVPGDWKFVFDSAKQRAGLCNYTDRQISLSKYIVEHHSLDQSIQVILHEIAHALAGKSAGHGPNWKKQAQAIGYRGEKFTGKEIAEQTARWIGECRNGHRHYRFKSPRVQLACGYCGKGFNPKYLISWSERAA